VKFFLKKDGNAHIHRQGRNQRAGNGSIESMGVGYDHPLGLFRNATGFQDLNLCFSRHVDQRQATESSRFALYRPCGFWRHVAAAYQSRKEQIGEPICLWWSQREANFTTYAVVFGHLN
jgi:hypothetical protein